MNTLATEKQHGVAYRHAITEIVSKNGWDLKSLSREAPALVVFLRHFNCIYCRESLAELKRLRSQIEAEGAQIAVVHMGTESQAEELLSFFDLSDVERFSDPEQRLYSAFGLERTTLGRLLAPASWIGLVRAGLKSPFIPGNKLKGIVGDVLQMPGVFLLSNGSIVGDFKPERVDKRPEYLELAAMKC
ncbi:MAG: SelL-related redox protein [Opitutaceae bacterium]